jgi:uncharacterized small protein (TIGR04563 family)
LTGSLAYYYTHIHRSTGGAAGAARRTPHGEDLMAGSDKRKQSLYFPEDLLKEIQEEANRQDRSLSWIVQKAWKIARKEIMKYPSVNEFPGDEDEREKQE